MGELSGALQNRIAPPVANFKSMDFSAAEVDDQVGKQSEAPKIEPTSGIYSQIQ